jgi:uncharacterized membrane protein YbhN (UPF0104 family)
MRRGLLTLLRVLVSLGLVAWLVWANREGLAGLGSFSVAGLGLAAGVFALSTVLGAWQWSLILRRGGIEVSAARLHAVYWIGLFFNNFLPSNVGGDLVKVSDIALSTGQLTRAVAGTLLDRMLGLSALVCVAFAAGSLLRDEAPAGLPWWALTLLVLIVWSASAALLSGRLGRLGMAVVARLRHGKPSGRLRSLLSELQTWRADRVFVLRLAALAFVVQCLRVLTHVLVARAMDISLDATTILQFYVLIPILGVAVVLPISFNGLGVREFVATRLMPEIGVAASSALALQFTTYLVQVGVSLVGGLIFAVMFLRGSLGRRREG